MIKIKPKVEDRIIKKQKRGGQKQSEGGKRRKKKQGWREAWCGAVKSSQDPEGQGPQFEYQLCPDLL